MTVAPLLAVAAQAALGGPLPDYSLAIWHGFNLPLLMSLVAMVGGVAAYYFLQRFYDIHRYVHSPVTGHWLYHEGLEGLLGFSVRVTHALQNGSLQRYLALIVAASLVLAAWPFFEFGYSTGPSAMLPAHGLAIVVWGLLVVASLATVAWHRERLTALIMISTVGLVPTLVFVYFSAPDLALTQVAVEVVTIVLLLLALHHLPQHTPAESSRPRKLRDAALAIAAGGGVAAIAYAVMTRPFESLSDYYLERSLPGGGGTNVVNVILVDFRGFDTFGEIIVLAIAALGVVALLDGLRLDRSEADHQGRRWAAESHSVMVTVLVRLLLPLAMAASVYFFLRGHNLPGGGFVAGLVTSIALVLLYVANGVRWTASRLQLDLPRMVSAGVLIAGLTGIGSWFFARPFLTSASAHPTLPLIGELPLATAALFDLGVYLTVVGAVMLMLSSLVLASDRPGPGPRLQEV